MSTVLRLDLERVVRFYESFSPASLRRLAEVYAADARFVAPFNDVVGPAAIEAVFRRLFRYAQEARICVISRMVAGDEAWLEWEFHFRFRGWRETQIQVVRGATRLAFGPDGRIVLHRDYWDTGEEFFATLPGVAMLLRLLRRRMVEASRA